MMVGGGESDEFNFTQDEKYLIGLRKNRKKMSEVVDEEWIEMADPFADNPNGEKQNLHH